LAEATRGSLGDFESPFEEAVAKALSAKGWQLHTQVGASAFRVDLGVVHPDTPGTYLSGIECDGATYHRSATARDRDKLREQVLRGLGWEICRVWSTDWWVDKRGTLERLDQQLQLLLKASRAKRERESEKLAAKLEAETAFAKASAVADIDEVAIDASIQNSPLKTAPRTLDREKMYAGNAANFTSDASLRQTAIFTETELEQFAGLVSVDKFFDDSYEPVLIDMISLIVATEGPVLDAVVARRISRAHGWQRTGSRIVERVKEIALRCSNSTEEDVGTFYWPKSLTPGATVVWRTAVNDAQRSVDEVCAEELRSLAALVFDPVRGDEWMLIQMARQLGLMKLRAASRPRLQAAIRAISAGVENGGA
jgi:very-short-patch-repair endonuclease